VSSKSLKFSPAEASLVFERFLLDARDDFFQDPIDYGDLKYGKAEIAQLISQEVTRFIADPKLYSPREFFHWDVPKKNFVVRSAIMLHPRDRLLHHAVLHLLVGDIHGKTATSCFSYRVQDPKAKWLFGPKPTAHWLSFKKAALEAFHSRPKAVMVSTDIAGFYEYINILDYKKQLLNLVGDSRSAAVEFLTLFLKRLAYAGTTGIPQNYDPSSFLTSAFLDFFDKEVEAKGYQHFRYVDDIKVVVDSEKEAKAAIVELIRVLRQKNLNLQTGKTEIWAKGSPGLLSFGMEFPELLSEVDDEIERKRKKEIDRLLPDLVTLTNKTVSATEFNDQLFRACIWRIVKCHYFRNLDKVSLNKITLKCIRLLVEMPGKSDSFLDFMVLEKEKKYVQKGIFEVARESVYPWQKVQIWNMLTKVNKLKHAEILQFAQQEIRSNRKHDPAVNSIILFLGKHGTYNDRELLVQIFGQPHSYFTKRCILLALQEYPDRGTIYNQVETSSGDPFLTPLVRYIKNLKSPKYINENVRIGSDLAFIS